MKKQFTHFIISAKISKDNQTTTEDFFSNLRKNNANIKVTTEEECFIVSDIDNTAKFQEDVREYSIKQPNITSRLHTTVGGQRINGCYPTYIDIMVSY